MPLLSLGRLGRRGSAWGAGYHDVQRQKGHRQNKEERDSAPYLGKWIEIRKPIGFHKAILYVEKSETSAHDIKF